MTQTARPQRNDFFVVAFNWIFVGGLNFVADLCCRMAPVLFLLIVLIVNRTLQSLLLLCISILTILFFWLFYQNNSRLLAMVNVAEDFLKRYPDIRLRNLKLSDFVDETSLTPISPDSNFSTALVRFGNSLYRRSSFLYLFEVQHPSHGKFPSSLAAYHDLGGGAFIFIPAGIPHSLRKYFVCHEIGHGSAPGAIFAQSPFVLYGVAYLLVALIAPWFLNWSITTALLYVILVINLLDLVLTGAGIDPIASIGTKLNSEIIADIFAVNQMNSEEKANLAKLVNRKKRFGWDEELGEDGNIIRRVRLLDGLKDGGYYSPYKLTGINNLHIYWRMLFVILLGIHTHSPNYYHVALGALVAIIILGVGVFNKTIIPKTARILFRVIDDRVVK